MFCSSPISAWFSFNKFHFPDNILHLVFCFLKHTSHSTLQYPFQYLAYLWFISIVYFVCVFVLLVSFVSMVEDCWRSAWHDIWGIITESGSFFQRGFTLSSGSPLKWGQVTAVQGQCGMPSGLSAVWVWPRLLWFTRVPVELTQESHWSVVLPPW